MKVNFNLLMVICAYVSNTAFAQSQPTDVNDDWQFTPGYAYNMQKNPPWENVNLPHTWNATDADNGNIAYYRGLGVYKKSVNIDKENADKRFFLHFEGSATVTDVWVNGHHVGHHNGGYTAFVFEITKAVAVGENEFLVMVNNAYDSEVMPLVGDFNVYGGLFRPVHLIVKEKVGFDLSNYGSPGVLITQKKVTKEMADIAIDGAISDGSAEEKRVTVQVVINDATGKIVLQKDIAVEASKSGSTDFQIPLSIPQPKLWNGRKDPYRYSVHVSLATDNGIVDQTTQPLGLRFFHLDPDKGFFLNGHYLDLQGVCYHEATAGKGSALTAEDSRMDFQIMTEMGVNAIRTSHYPRANQFYDFCDSIGIVVYTEIPQVGPGGYIGRGFINSEGFKANGKEQLKEMIRQHYNHPSIIFWGLYNELKIQGDDPYEYLKELNALAKQEDPNRYTMGATFQDNHNNDITDAIGWNKYFGWYGGSPEQIGSWVDAVHLKEPKRSISISEYGAGASVKHHSDSLKAPNPSGTWHPEEWQTYYHEKNWKALKARPFIWGKFIWVMFDFGAAHRSEGDTKGVNDKGLVTADRQIKKDAYFFYKANWNPEPMLTLAEKRFAERIHPKAKIKAFTNLSSVDFYLNGKKIGSAKPENGIVLSKEISLKPGENSIEVRGKNKSTGFNDKTVWVLH